MNRVSTQGTRYISDWRDHTSQARRQHIYGAIEPMDRLERDGKPYRFELILSLGMIIATAAVIFWSATQ